MEPFTQGLIVGSGFTTGLFSIGFFAFSLLNKLNNEPIMRKMVIPSGGPAFGKKDKSKHSPKVITEFNEWKKETENEG